MNNRQFLVALLAALVSLLFSAATHGDVTIEGDYQILTACYLDQGVHIDEDILTDDTGRTYTLVYHDEDIERPQPGSRIEVTGRLQGNVIIVRVLRIIEVRGGDNPSTGEQKFCVILFNFLDDTRENVTPERVAQMMFDTNNSADKWWREASYGRMWSSGDVYGWYTLPVNRGCDPSNWRRLAIEIADDDIYYPDYNRLFLLMPQGGGCGWGGLGTLGMSTYQTDDGPWRTTTSWCRSEYYNNINNAIAITTHEGGHNLGQHHARAIRFAAGPLGQYGCGGCGQTRSEYGDRLDTLGSWNLGHYTTLRKQRLEWLDPDQVPEVRDSGRFEIEPFETPTGNVKSLRIWRGGSEWLYAEWRQPIGYDADIDWRGGHNYRGLLLHYHWGENSTATYLADFTFGDQDWLNSALPFGEEYQDPFTDMWIRSGGESNGKQIVDVSFAADVTDVEARFGSLDSGGPDDLERSDDAYVVARSEFTSGVAETNVLVLDGVARTRLANANSMRLLIEGKVDTPDATVTVRLRNRDTGQMQRVARFGMGIAETVEVIEGLDPDDFLNGDNEVEFSIKTVIATSFVPAGFQQSLDRVEFNFR